MTCCRLPVLLILAAMATACAPSKGAMSIKPAVNTNLIYECPTDYEFLARIEGEVAHLTLPDRTVTLVHQPSASGVKYSRGDVTFWTWQGEAMLEIGHETRMTCTLNPQRASLK